METDYFQRLIQNAQEHPHDVVLQTIRESGRETLTGAQFLAAVRQFSHAAVAAGLAPGDRAALILENDHHWVVALLGLTGAGVIAVPLDPAQSPAKLTTAISHAGCRLLCGATAFAPGLLQIRSALPALRLVVRPSPQEPAARVPDSTSWEEFVGAARPDAGPWPLVEHDPEADFLLVYTGGTTGSPKGVRLSLRSLLVCIQDTTSVFPLAKTDHILSILPLFHIMAIQASVLGPLYRGARVTYLLSRDPQRIVRAFAEERITAFLCVPLFYYQLRRRIWEEVSRQSSAKQFVFQRLLRISRTLRQRFGINAGRRLFRPIHAKFGPALRGFGVGGARFAPEIAAELHDLGFAFFQGYGMTETSALSSLTPLSVDGGVSCGRPLRRARIEIDQPSPEGIGEVKISGPHLMSGYWRDEQATAAVLRDGWLWTGDLGYLDEQGRLHITGRKKDVIVLSSGKNVFPEPLEQHYQSACPYIAELCILGTVTSTGAAERLHAVIVPDTTALARDGKVNIRDAVLYQLQAASRGLPSHERLLGFDLRRDPLPRTSARKLQRFLIAEELTTATTPTGAAEEPVSPAGQTILALIQQMKGVRATPAMDLELDVGLDSLERVELLANVQERFAAGFTDAQSAGILTVGDLITAAEGGTPAAPGSDAGWQDWDDLLRQPLTPAEAELVDRHLGPRPIAARVLWLLTRLTCLLAEIFLRYRTSGPPGWPDRFPFVIAANHQSYLDVPLLTGRLPLRVFDRIFFLSASRLHGNWFQRWFGRTARAVPIDPDRSLRSALRVAAEGLRRGMVLCVFPEGHRAIDENLQPFRKSLAILVVHEQVGVVPAAFHGATRAWGSKTRDAGAVQVSSAIGELLRPAPGESPETFNARLFAAVQLLKAHAAAQGGTAGAMDVPRTG